MISAPSRAVVDEHDLVVGRDRRQRGGQARVQRALTKVPGVAEEAYEQLAGRYGDALPMLAQMVTFFPDEPASWLYLGLAHHRARQERP